MIDLNTNPPEGVVVEEADNLKSWKIKLIGAAGTIYEGEEFKLEFRFTPQYPLEAPDVVFVRPYVPVHPQYTPMGTFALTFFTKIGLLFKQWLMCACLLFP
ncbi:hypothetical protein HMPREF1544_09135 [Mucor circinelloides 1006PhL]|uniref:UBC core domain-containing protein n=1 Tax=Mucor circinelloides f. circinelloides (strain 1006PhL) TaxID=1220926 RepID=S2J1Y3_MUCC1|nr:hypothetical protein HMPREF1544_09135 [Mucor circinelloides 1006PhL]